MFSGGKKASENPVSFLSLRRWGGQTWHLSHFMAMELCPWSKFFRVSHVLQLSLRQGQGGEQCWGTGGCDYLQHEVSRGSIPGETMREAVAAASRELLVVSKGVNVIASVQTQRQQPLIAAPLCPHR